MKYKEISTKTDKELTVLLADSRKKLAEALIEMRTKQVSNVKAIAGIKKTIARAETALKEKDLKLTEESNG